MAYTYDDFLKTAAKTNMLGRFDKNDLQITRVNPDYGLSMLSLMKDRENAKTPESRLLTEEAINQLKTSMRPLITPDGSNSEAGSVDTGTDPQQPSTSPTVQEPTTALPNPDGADEGAFSYDKEDEYQKLMAAITNPDRFQYDHESDPNWGAYRKAYLREGERATADALARAAAATGGIPSTYAITAAQQAGANYADQLAGLIPTLEQNAYSRYLNQQDMQLNALQLLQAERENEYAKYLAQKELEAKQEKQGQTQTDDGSDLPLFGISEGDLAYLKSTYPTGMISDKYFWDAMVAEYGEAALAMAGFYFATPAGNTGVDPIGRAPGGAFIDRVSGTG